ncbi:hypothetical protein QPK24_12170 [Paenibacillus polygoni]|uniref:Uncharacterized protein n=1 Tax=Paenibacillus polygoni TaxID=3050112 RepID=A0ABY8WWF9_9BACL|nr:hypothetical protein [Paenibacillus polygoni]WIV17210.1 hypothetical protein QPK24_12170 [Paenibacillus polygoni]
MEFKFGDASILLPPLHITIIAAIILFLLVRWSKQLETRRFTVFFYFFISTSITPIYSRGTRESVFELWIPLGFLVVLFYLFRSERNHPSKMKASFLGLSIAIYQLILQYNG